MHQVNLIHSIDAQALNIAYKATKKLCEIETTYMHEPSHTISPTALAYYLDKYKLAVDNLYNRLKG